MSNYYKIAIIGSGNREHTIADKLSANGENLVYLCPKIQE